ncbi:exodeoxyribonuclease VII small subunit [Pararhodonellum marinum]|uniref:exodeoxyribonuclease VII small subunit n=1 Tax=Pararhodonellum marinum TaxID=2755358 RepID=UPI00189087EF|nr:exodeoxyribonuclease VII small subunit [Pararhodonellum marinum]
MSKKEIKPSYDKSLERIIAIVDELEKNDKGIDELSDMVKEAADLIKYCKAQLRQTEEEISQAFGEGEG